MESAKLDGQHNTCREAMGNAQSNNQTSTKAHKRPLCVGTVTECKGCVTCATRGCEGRAYVELTWILQG